MEHLKCAIQKRLLTLLTYTDKLRALPKMVVPNINQIISKDYRSTAGENICQVSLSCGANPITGPTRADISEKGFEAVPTGEEGRVYLINKLIVM